jgi:hypothetical protein
MLDEHEIDLMLGEDEEPTGLKLANEDEITPIEAYQASVTVC